MPEITIQQAFDLAVQHHQAGRLNEAESIYRQILAVEPRHADALHLLGVIAHQVGRNDVAIDLIRQAIALAPGDQGFHSNLGVALYDSRRLDEAVAAYRQSIALKPDCALAHNNLGNALKDKGQLDEAIAAYRQAITLLPNYPEAHNNLGSALKNKGQIEQAIAAYRHAIALKPDFSEVHSNLGNALRDKGQLDEAISAFRQAIALKPDFAEAHGNLGIALNDVGRLDEAIAACRQALALKPHFAEASNNLGLALSNKGQLDEAIAAYRQAIALKPDFAEVHSNLGGALNDKGQIDEAFAAYRQALALRPNYHEAHSNLIFRMNYQPGLEASTIADEHRSWNQAHAEPMRQFILPHANDRSPDRRLRIGYVSPDFQAHSVAYFLESLLEHHDHAQFEVCGYSDVMNPDAVTARMESLSTHWRRIIGLSDSQVAELIRADDIDILVDLAGHTGNNRLLVFARKPAPVQVTWLGYSNKTGLDMIDYRLTDAFADPPGSSDDLPGEQLFRLPKTFACFRPAESAPPVGLLPAAGRGQVTFASFHMLSKINDALLESWAEILNNVSGSRLMMVAAGLDAASISERFSGFFTRRGIDAGRLEFKGRQMLADYLALHHEVDVLLDSHPFSGHTVSCHALWMGVPVVTLAGKSHCSRMVASVLRNVGLAEWIATSPEEYVKLAVELANDFPRLAELRATLREKMQASPLMDAAGFARDIETAYRNMWRNWCSQPESPPCPK